jgi:hypothetical protein
MGGFCFAYWTLFLYRTKQMALVRAEKTGSKATDTVIWQTHMADAFDLGVTFVFARLCIFSRSVCS